MVKAMSHYGYVGLFIGVLADQLGIPLPSMLVVMAAGALAGLGELNLGVVIVLIFAASMIGDLFWYEIGRRRGAGVLGFLCRFSLESDTCVRDTQNKFVRRGPKTLLFAKFLPGLSTLAPPLAGLAGTSLPVFLVYNSIGTILWVATFVGIGFFGSDEFEVIANYLSRLGAGVLIALIAAAALFAVVKYVIRRRFLKQIMTARISTDELREMIENGEDVIIADLRHEMDFNSDPRKIPGARRMAMAEIEENPDILPREREIVLYCSCPNEATSASVAIKLHRLGIKRVRPLAGGFSAWQELGFPLE